jgi:hypothetical protein
VEIMENKWYKRIEMIVGMSYKFDAAEQPR